MGRERVGRTIGRRRELDEVEHLLETLRSGSAAVLVLRGEAGIGKSHLCRDAVTRAGAAGIRTAVGQADELEQDRPGRLLLAIERALLAGEPSAGTAPALDAGDDPGYRTVERFLTAVDRATARGPVLLVAEDLHWADDLSLRGLASLVRSIDQMPCALLATERIHPRPRRSIGVEPGTAGPSDRVRGRVVVLAGLANAEIAQLVTERLGAPPGPTLRSMLAGAAGNPFVVDALLRAVRDEDLVHVASGVAEVRAGDVPTTVDEALVHHLHTLEPESVELLRLASLLGRFFTAAEVAVITGSSVVEVVRLLGDAAGAGMVVAGDDHHEFRHDLVRDAVYRSIPPAARWDLHRAAGAALAAAGAPALRVAQQFIAGARPGDLEAAEWLQRASVAARAVDTGAAAELLQRALMLMPPHADGRFELEADLVELLAWSGQIEDALRRAHALVDRSVGDLERFRAHQALGTVLSTNGDLRRAADHLLAASATAAADPSTAELLRDASAGMSVIAGTMSPADARTLATPSVDSDRADVVCWARNTLAVAAVCEGAYDEVIEHARVAAAILDERYVQPLGFLIPHTWVMTGLQYLDRYDEAQDAGERARARAERRGDTGLLVQVMAGTCGISWARGDWDDTVAEIDAAMALMDDTGIVTHAILFHSLAARIALERGEPGDAMTHLGTAEAFAASGSLHLFGLDILVEVQAHLAAATDPELARELLAGAWEATAPLRGLIQWRSIGPELARLCVATGREAQAAAIADEVRVLAGRSTARSAAATVTRVEGLVRRDPRKLVDAADALLATPRRIEAAGACEEAVGLLLETSGPMTDVERLLDAAEETYLSAECTVAIERLAELRRRAGLEAREGRPPRVRFGWEALSPKELEVVGLVSRGMSNPDIAAEMYISRRTVEAHLSHVFQKVDVSNRTQLAREAIERGVV